MELAPAFERPPPDDSAIFTPSHKIADGMETSGHREHIGGCSSFLRAEWPLPEGDLRVSFDKWQAAIPENQLQESSALGYLDRRMANVTVDIPEEVLALAGLPGGSASGRATQLLALELFREGRVSLGRAAELADLSVEEFMEFSAHRQVSLHYTEADLAEDRATAERLKL